MAKRLLCLETWSDIGVKGVCSVLLLAGWIFIGGVVVCIAGCQAAKEFVVGCCTRAA